MRFAVVLIVGIVGLSSMATAGTTVASINGAGQTLGQISFSVSATRQLDGSGAGEASYCGGFDDPQQTCVAGRVFQVELPAPGSDYWCVTSLQDNPGPGGAQPYNAILLYYRDDETGKDEIDFKSGPGTTVDCNHLPSAPDFRPLASGALVAWPS